MNSPSIAFYDTKPYEVEAFERANRTFGYTFRFFPHRLTADTALSAQGSHVVCAFVNDTISPDVVEILRASKIQLIALRCAGYNNVDLKAVYGKMHVVRVPAYSPEAIAEHAVALALSLNRKTHRAYFRTRDHNFSIVGLTGFNMQGKTAGIIGTGKIGRALAPILKGFGMRVLCCDKFADPAWAQQAGCEYVPLDHLYAQSDIISLHCPLTRESHHLISEEALSQMKRGVVLINTSRGPLIDTQALIEALKSGHVGAAGLDVYEEESEYFFEDFSGEILSDDILARLLTFPNVLVTSHQAFLTQEALGAIAGTTLQNIQDYFEGKALTNEICYRCGGEQCVKKLCGRCFPDPKP